MASWFDTFAKKSAVRSGAAAPESRPGLSRRQLLVRGSAVAAVWSAPVLTASSAAAVGASTCTSANPKYCPGTTPSTGACCLTTDTCTQTGGVGGCAAQGQAGGECNNNGVGTCSSGYKCNGNTNQCQQCAGANICGGEGSQCCRNSFPGCANDGVCVQQGSESFCRRACGTGKPCNSGQVCTTSGYCAQACGSAGNMSCGPGTSCSGGFCQYRSTGNLSCPSG